MSGLEKESRDLAEVNLKLNKELANHGSEANELQTKLAALVAEMEQTADELQASKITIEDLTKQLTTEGGEITVTSNTTLNLNMF